MSNEIINPAAAVSPTPEEIQAQIDHLNALKSNMENGTQEDESTPSNQNASDDSQSPATNTIDSETIARIRHLVEKAISSYFYMSNSKRVAALEEALKIPVSDDKSFQQFYNHADKDLEKAAGQAARLTKTVPEEVTPMMIMAEAQKRYMAKHGKLAIVNEEYMI